MTDTQLMPFTPDAIPLAWELVEDKIDEVVLRAHGCVDADDIRKMAERDAVQLWAAIDPDTGEGLAIAITEIVDYPKRSVCKIVGLAGDQRERWEGHLAEIESWAKERGCSLVRVFGRKGLVKMLPTYKMAGVVLEKELTDA